MNSKTKIIIGIIAIGIILAIFWMWNKQLPQNNTDKKAYGMGENITFRVDDKVETCTEELPYTISAEAFGGEKRDKLVKWFVKLQHSCGGFAGYGIDQYCENGKIRTERVGRCNDMILCENKSIHETFMWDQIEYVEITEQCEGKTIKREVKKQVPAGTYQIMVNGKVIKELSIGKIM